MRTPPAPSGWAAVAHVRYALAFLQVVVIQPVHVHAVVAAMLLDVALAWPGGAVDHLHQQDACLVGHAHGACDGLVEAELTAVGPHRMGTLRQAARMGERHLDHRAVRIVLVEPAQHEHVVTAVWHRVMRVERADFGHRKPPGKITQRR